MQVGKTGGLGFFRTPSERGSHPNWGLGCGWWAKTQDLASAGTARHVLLVLGCIDSGVDLTRTAHDNWLPGPSWDSPKACCRENSSEG